MARSHSGAAAVYFFGGRIEQFYAQLASAPKSGGAPLVNAVGCRELKCLRYHHHPTSGWKPMVCHDDGFADASVAGSGVATPSAILNWGI